MVYGHILVTEIRKYYMPQYILLTMYVTRPSCWRRNSCCYRTLNFVRYLTVALALVIVVYFIMKSGLHALDDSLLQLDKCPACFGMWEDVCQAISAGKLKVRKNYFWNSESVKGVWYGVWNNSPVVVKQLGHGGELAMLDQEICLNTTEPVSKHCNVHEKVLRSFLNPGLAFKRAVMQFMECPCEQFSLLVENKLRNKMNVVHKYQKIMALTNLQFNQEFLFLQVFSKRYSKFLPALYGACGRVIVVEYVGPTLWSALDRPWEERVKISINLIQLARTFTKTQDNIALYMYDVVMNNFAVDKHGLVKLIDCEHVLIADTSAFSQTYVTKTKDFCAPEKFECLTFVPEDLCEGQAQDHNYYAICRNILAAIGSSKGLLHSPPDSEIESKLKYLLNNCIHGKEISRELAIEKLEKELYTYIL